MGGGAEMGGWWRIECCEVLIRDGARGLEKGIERKIRNGNEIGWRLQGD